MYVGGNIPVACIVYDGGNIPVACIVYEGGNQAHNPWVYGNVVLIHLIQMDEISSDKNKTMTTHLADWKL